MEESKVKTTGQIISVFQRGKGFPVCSADCGREREGAGERERERVGKRDRNRKHLERRWRGGDVEKCEANVEITGVGGNRFKAAVSAEND